MICTVKYFGMIAEKLNIDSEEIVIDSNTEDLFDLDLFFKKRHFSLLEMTFKTAVNGVLTNKIELNQLAEVKEIAILPPFAGG